MRHTLIIIAILFLSQAKAQEDYVIRINDTTFKISLDKKYALIMDGRKINFILSANDTLIYNDDLYSFLYSKDFKVSKTKVEGGIEQIMLMTAEGSGILIQKYPSLNPTTLNEIMLTEVIKESLSYGYELKRNDYNRTLSSGQKIRINKAILKYKDDTNVYEVASIGKKDEGILIITMVMDQNNSKQGQKLIDLMWSSLIYK